MPERDVETVREFQEHVENSRPGRHGVYIVQSKADDLAAALTRLAAVVEAAEMYRDVRSDYTWTRLLQALDAEAPGDAE